MTLSRNLISPFIFLFLAGFFFLSAKLFAQEDVSFLDLGVEFTNPPSSVKINGVFGITGRVYLEANSTDTSESITVKIYLKDPNGIILDSHTQSWSGFNQSTNGVWSKGHPEQMLFQIPWSQSVNWQESARWTLSAEIISSSIDANTNNDTATISFGLDVPDLRTSIETVSAVEPLSGAESDNYVPNTNYTVSGSITNFGNVTTQPGIYIPVSAKLIRIGESGDQQGVMDEETILLPAEDQFETLMPNASWEFKIENLFLPANASGNFAVLVTVNPQDIPSGPVQIESSYLNNADLHPGTPQDTNADGASDIFIGPFINISSSSDVNETSARPDLRYVEGSYAGERGSFRGLEPVYLSFAIRNSGNRIVAPGDSISAQILLSKDLSADAGDFLLREFNLGGSGIGEGLLAGETINLTWFQQMPDNYEGDYYLLLRVDNLGSETTTIIDDTPIFTLVSEGLGTTSLLDTANGTVPNPAERPDSSEDGRFVVYEKTLEVSGQEYQQIYIIDMEQPNPEPELISRSYNSTAFSSLPSNGNSFRPKISQDGSTVVFYSSATNIVPGDTNNKEDVFLYRISTDTVFRAVITQNNGSSTEQLDGRSLYPDVNGDGSRVVFESDATNVGGGLNSGSAKQIFLWSLNEDGGGSIEVITAGNGSSYNPSIDNAGRYVVFDSFATDLVTGDTNNLRDVFLRDLESNTTYLASRNYEGNQTEGGPSLNPRISGNGERIVYESSAQNLVSGTGIAKVVVTEGGYGYAGNPTIRVFEDDFNSSGARGRGAILTLREQGINLLQEIRADAILIVDPGEGYVSPRVEITPDPAYPAPLQEAKAVAYLANPLGDVYYIDVADITSSNNSPIFSKRISESSSGTGGNFGSRDLSISSDGNSIVYATKSSNLLPQEVVRDDGKTFYNSNYILPSAKAVLVGGIGEIEIQSMGSGYTAGTLRIEDLSGSGSGAQASYRVDNRGRIVFIDILSPGVNYRLDQTIVSVSEPRGGSGFNAGVLRFEPTRGEGVNRSGGGRIYKVEMSEFGYGYKIGDDENASFADIIQFEGDGADLNEDGFPDGRLNPDRVKNINGSLYLEQRFDIEILSLGADLLNTTLTLSDNNNSLKPLRIEFSDTSDSSQSTIVVNQTMDRNAVRDELIRVIYKHFLPEYFSGGAITKVNEDVEVGPVVDNNQTGTNRFSLAALSGQFRSSNPSAIRVVELSNMLVMGSGYTTVTPVINQVPNIYGFSETQSNPSFELDENVGRVALLSQEDTESDDIYLYSVDQSQNFRISTSSFGMPVGYLSNNPGQSTALSNRFPSISGNGRYVFFSSDAWGSSGLAFSGSNQLPVDGSAVRDIYLRDLKTYTTNNPKSQLELLFPQSGIKPFAPQSSIPVIADLNHSGTVSRVAMILNQTDRGGMTEFNGGTTSAYKSGRYTAMINNIESGEYSLQLVAYGSGNQVVATSSLIRFSVKDFRGSLPPVVTMEDPSGFSKITSSSIIPLSSQGYDPDGALIGVQYYVDGQKYKPEQFRIPGISEETQSFPITLKIEETIVPNDPSHGVRSLFVMARDNSGNYVASNIYNLSFTTGSQPPEISLTDGISTIKLEPIIDFNATFDPLGAGSIDEVTLKEFYLPVGIYSARIDVIHESGTGADFDANITIERSADGNVAKIEGVIIKSGGQGYDATSLELRIIPEIRAINEGIPAEAGVTYVYEFNDTSQLNLFQSSDIALRQNVDGSLRVGSGYVIAPRLLTPPFAYLVVNGKSWERAPLNFDDISSSGTTSVDPFFLNDLPFFVEDAQLVGGFAQSPIIIDINATESLIGEKIESVSLVIDGKTSEELTKTSYPYSFSWAPDEPRDYSITAVVRDVAGNVNSTEENIFSVVNYHGSGIRVSFNGDSNFSVESNGFLQLSADATSDYGSSEVEFYIDDKLVSRIVGDGVLTSFQDIIDMSTLNLRQGEHEVSVLARDFKGNTAGTFSKRLTNIESRMNKVLFVKPPEINNPPAIELISPSANVSLTANSSIRLLATASDPDGGLKGVQFYTNQETIYSWNGSLGITGSSLPGDGSLLTIDDGTGRGAFTFEFDDDLVVEGGDKPDAIADYGNYLNDLEPGGKFTFPNAVTFTVEIDGVLDSGDTYKWSADGGVTFIDEKREIESGISQTLMHGISITFGNSSGHHVGDRWRFTAYPKNQIITISDTDEPSINAKITKHKLFEAIKNLHALGVLSIDAHLNDFDNSIHLRHTQDLPIKNNVSVTGTSLNYLNYLSSSDDMLLAFVPESTQPQPFGATWAPSASGNYVILAVAEDFSGNRVSSQAVIVSVVDAQGAVPKIELSDIESTASFDGTAFQQTLNATAQDPDGSIAMVTFYSNGTVIGTDSSRPFSASIEINATGNYEFYAVARDNSGNLVTSNIQYLMVDAGGAAPEQSLTVGQSNIYTGGTISVNSSFKSPSGDYDPDIRAMVFINSLYEGDAEKLPRTPPSLGQEDPGQSFLFETIARGVGRYDVEIVILNGTETTSAISTITISESPLTDDYQFLKALWNGLFDRDPVSTEINGYLAGLQNGSMTRPHVIEHIRIQQEFITSRDVLLTHKTLHGVWERLPIVLENTDQQGYGSMGGGGNSAAAQAAMGMPYTPADGNASDLGFYDGVTDDHSDLFEFPTEVQMNDPSVLSIISKQADRDVFKLKSLNLPDEGLLTIELNRAPLGTLIRSSIVNPLAQGAQAGDFPDHSILVQFSDGSFVTHRPQGGNYMGPRWNRPYARYEYDLSSFQNVESYIFSVLGYNHRAKMETLGAVRLTISNDNYLDQANFLTEEEIALLQIESRVNDFNPTQAITYQTNSFSYTNRYGQIEMHDPESFFNRLFRNKYEQDPSPIQVNRGVQLLKEDSRTQLEFLHDFATENEVITVGGYNYTTSDAQLAIPNVPIDAAAFAETALVYSALLGEAPSNAEVALFTLTPDFEVRPLAKRAGLIMEKPEYAKQYGVAVPEISFVGIQNGQFLSGGDVIKVEASSLGVDDLASTVDDGKVLNVELFLNGKSQGMMTTPSSGEFFYSLMLDSTVQGGEYLLEAVAEDINGLQSTAEQMIRIASTSNTDIEITTPALGSTLEWGETVDFNFSSETTLSHAYLEINGRAQWAAILSYEGNDLPEDGSTFSIDDGTGRGPITFEFDDDGLANEIYVNEPENLTGGSGEIALVNSEYLGTEDREYLIEIDDSTGTSRTFRWSVDGGKNFNQTQEPADLNNAFGHALSAGIDFKFTGSSPGYSLGDRWRIKAGPVNQIVEIGKLGTSNDRIERTRINLINAINRARNEGKLAVRAENPYFKGIYMGSLPEQYIEGNSIILHHDASYPVVADIDIDINETELPLSSEICMDLIEAETGFSVLLGGCLDIPVPLISVRVVGFDLNGHRYYSRENTYQVKDSNIPFTKLLKIGDVFEPGRLPTIQVSQVNSSTGSVLDWEILDQGIGYKELVSKSHDLVAVGSFGSGAKFLAEISALGTVESLGKVGLGGQNHKAGDIISPSPSAVFEVGEMINLEARLIGPKSQIERVAFYANGVEISGETREMIGGYYSSTFQPSDPGDYFISVRPLYGDSRDSMASSNSVTRGANNHFASNDIWGWKNLWSQQFISSSTFSSPVWFWQNSSYWDTDISWKSRTNWSGAAAVRVIEPADVSGEIDISLNQTSLALRANNLLDSQLTQLKANVTRSSRNAPRLVRAILYGNESVLGEISIPESNSTTSTLTFEWEVSFRESGKTIVLTVVGIDENDRKYYSDTASNSILELDGDNPESAVGQIFQDLTGAAASPDKISELSKIIDGNDSMAEVVASVLENSPNLLENLIDLVAAQHIVFGKFFESFNEFQDYTEYWLPIFDSDATDEPLKRYIDMLLGKSLYLEVFRGGVPHLVGAPTANPLIDFRENRNLFVARHFSLKYGRNPSTLQLKQASQRMLDYWSNNHEPGYWETISSNSAASEAESYSGFRRDTILSRRPTPFDAGECAVDFIYQLAKEYVFARNQGYLSYISNSTLRNSLYRTVALLYSLHRENVDTSDKSVFDQAKALEGLSIDEILRNITTDSSFNRRFNIVFDSNSVDVKVLSSNGRRTDWKSMPWFGTFMDSEFPWIYHVDLGWLYSNGTSTDDIWFYSDKLKVQGEEVGWFWTNNAVFDGPSQAGAEYGDQRFIFLMRKLQDGSREGSWALLNIETGEARPYGWLPLGK